MQKLQRHDLTFQITRGEGKEKSQPQRCLFLSAESVLKSCLDFAPFTPFVSFIRKIFPPVSPSASSFLRALFREAFTRRIRWCKDGRKGKFCRTCLLVLCSEARYNVGEEFSRSWFHRSCFENLIIFFYRNFKNLE